jgi:hypothetical protein
MLKAGYLKLGILALTDMPHQPLMGKTSWATACQKNSLQILHPISASDTYLAIAYLSAGLSKVVSLRQEEPEDLHHPVSLDMRRRFAFHRGAGDGFEWKESNLGSYAE